MTRRNTVRRLRRVLQECPSAQLVVDLGFNFNHDGRSYLYRHGRPDTHLLGPRRGGCRIQARLLGPGGVQAHGLQRAV
jgi:hypothetical protein